jgi:dCMP deaminase
MNVAEEYSKLSSAKRLQVGCVIVKDDTIIGIGYNGMPSGWSNVCEFEEGDELGGYVLKTRPEVIHAEENAIAKIAKSTNSSNGASLFVTHAPCIDCAKMIYQSGIHNVYYRNTYRSTDGIDFLNRCGVGVTHV